jgi:two-component system CheB/CheR fusion protein
MPERKKPSREKKDDTTRKNGSMSEAGDMVPEKKASRKKEDKQEKKGRRQENKQAKKEPQQDGREQSSRQPDKGSARPDFIVGVGASAGGLEALEALFGAMPEHTGMAFVVILHLKPDYKAMTAELLARKTALAVKEAQDGEKVRPDHVYVIPPGRDLQIYKGALQLMEPQHDNRPRTPIDTFFHSLATDQGERAVCIILSGMGSDGSLGLRDIKTELGMVMVQAQIFATDIDPESIEQARAGRFPLGIARDVPDERLERFFVREDNEY